MAMYQHLPYVSVNGDVLLANTVSFPFDNIGFLYGYGLFETLLIQNGVGIFVYEHFQRLAQSAKALKLPIHFSDDQFMTWTHQIITQNQVSDARLNAYLTADNFSAENGIYTIPSTSLWLVPRPFHPSTKRPPVQLTLKTESEPRTPFSKHKSMSYLRNFYEMVGHASTEDILWTDPQGHLLETCFSTVCIVQGKRIVSPLRNDIIPSVTRLKIQQAIETLGLKWEERKVHRSELSVANEIFLCSGIQGVIRVTSVAGYTGLRSADKTDLICKGYRDLVEQGLGIQG